MKTKSVVIGLVLSTLGFARAGGINWSYDGTFKFDNAIIVWTDERANKESCIADVGIKWLKVKEILETNSEGVTIDDIVKICERKSIGDNIFVNVITMDTLPVRINNELLYLGDNQGWGFSLFVNVDDGGKITNYAINQLTEGMINSSTGSHATTLTIKDENLQQQVSIYGNKRLEAVGAPKIGPYNEIGRIASDNSQTISFEITNAVNGFRYVIVESEDVRGPYVRNSALDLRADTDGRLVFNIPINPNKKAMFYKVCVGSK